MSEYTNNWQLLLDELRTSGKINPKTLASELRRSGPHGLPLEILNLLADDQCRKPVQKKRGRPKVDEERDQIVAWMYERALKRLLAAHRRAHTAKYQSQIAKRRRRAETDKTKYTPSERAARFVAKVLSQPGGYYTALSPASVINIASKIRTRKAREKANGTHRSYWRSDECCLP